MIPMCMSNWIQKNLHKELEETEKVWERESDLPQGKKYNCLVSMVSLEKNTSKYISKNIYNHIYIFRNIFLYMQ